MRRRHRVWWLIVLAMVSIVVAGCHAAVAHPTRGGERDVPFLRAGSDATGEHGIRVTGGVRVSERTYGVAVETSAIDPRATSNGNRLFVTLPVGYDPQRRYPVVYLLHGSGPGSGADQWVDAGMEETFTPYPVIAVSLDGGTAGWYNDWSDSADLTQRWESYHLEQAIAWVDSHLATQATRRGRAIVGFSAGGYGAVRYAERRPDLFSQAASLSGLLSFGSPSARDLIDAESADVGGGPARLFGDGVTTSDAQWDAHDPRFAVAALKDVRIQLFAGGGSGTDGDIEPPLTATSAELAQRLDQADVRYRYTMYGRPGSGCDGGHDMGCWRLALPAALVSIMSDWRIEPTSPPVVVPASMLSATQSNR